MTRMNQGMISPVGDNSGLVFNPNIVPTLAGIPITGVIGTAPGGAESWFGGDDFMDYLVRTPYFTATEAVTMVVHLDWPSAEYTADSIYNERYTVEVVLLDVGRKKQTVVRTGHYQPNARDVLFDAPPANSAGHISCIVDVEKPGTYYVAGRFAHQLGYAGSS